MLQNPAVQRKVVTDPVEHMRYKAERIQRWMSRNGLEEEEAERRIASQVGAAAPPLIPRALPHSPLSYTPY